MFCFLYMSKSLTESANGSWVPRGRFGYVDPIRVFLLEGQSQFPNHKSFRAGVMLPAFSFEVGHPITLVPMGAGTWMVSESAPHFLGYFIGKPPKVLAASLFGAPPKSYASGDDVASFSASRSSRLPFSAHEQES